MSYFVEYEVKRIQNIVRDESDPSIIKSLYHKANKFEGVLNFDRTELLYSFVDSTKTPSDLLNEIYYQHLKGKGAPRRLCVNLITNPNMKNPDILDDMLDHPYSDVRWYAVRQGILSEETLQRVYNQDIDFDVRYEAERQLKKLKKSN